MFPLSLPQTFETLFSPASLFEAFQSRFIHSSAKGVDRINGFQFQERAAIEFKKASEKCLAGTYRFSPYLENLKPKGRNKIPRLIAIPTIRDRVVLHQLNKLIALAFPESIPKNIASTYVQTIAEELKHADPGKTFICGVDIRSFYDAIQRERLLAILSEVITTQAAMALIRHALLTPTVPKNSRRTQYAGLKVDIGVPQGLAVSNILAAIYLAEIDKSIIKQGVRYFRYVDDVLMYGDEPSVRKAHKSLGSRLRRRGLRLHPLDSGKSHLGDLSKPFGYLGYEFRWPMVTVRASTVERLLQSLAAKFSEFKHNKTRRLERFKYLDEKRLSEIFLLELNERISGAVSEKRRYGWIAYFNQINDLSLLYRLDTTVRNFFSRLNDFDCKAPEGLKSFARAYFEMKFNPGGGYVHDYDKLITPPAKLAFLAERGRVSPDEQLTDEQISARFERYRRGVLSTMHEDEQLSYG